MKNLGLQSSREDAVGSAVDAVLEEMPRQRRQV